MHKGKKIVHILDHHNAWCPACWANAALWDGEDEQAERARCKTEEIEEVPCSDLRICSGCDTELADRIVHDGSCDSCKDDDWYQHTRYL